MVARKLTLFEKQKSNQITWLLFLIVRKAGLEQFRRSKKPLRKEVLTPSPEREPYREPLLLTPYLTETESF